MRRAHWMWVGLEAAPTALGVGELVGAFLSGVLDVPPGGDLMFRVCAAPVFVLILGVGTVVRRGWRSSWRVPCLVAPLALLFPLTPVSTMFGTGFAGIQLFVDGLVSMDPKVVSGFGAVLGTALIRVVHAVAAVRWPDRRVLAAVLVVGVGSWLPVAWVLDRSLLGELYSWEMSVFVLQGTTLRALAVAAMIVGTSPHGPAASRSASTSGSSGPVTSADAVQPPTRSPS